MHAILIELLTPVIPLLFYLQKQGQKRTHSAFSKPLIRYFIYTLINVLAVTLFMVFFGSGELSFTERFDRSSVFALKFLVLETFIIGTVTLADQTLLRYHIRFQISNSKFHVFIIKILLPSLLPLLAIVTVCLNGSLIFDHVLWGDEAFSVNTAAGNSIPEIMEILHYWDNHPPLYYLWLHLLVSLFGRHGFVYHLSAFLPFLVGILWALTAVRKHFGAVPAAIFITVSSLAAPCLEYNQEVRMYALAFLALVLCHHCSYLVIKGNKPAWFFLVFFGLTAAYSHYYALAAAGILLFFTGAGYFLRYGGKTWIPGILAILCYILGYLPWLPQLLSSANTVAGSWWMTELLPVGDALSMISGGGNMRKILLPLLILLTAFLLALDCGFIRADIQNADSESDRGHLNIRLCAPKAQSCTDYTYGCFIGVLTIIGTLLFAYLLCALIGPVLAQRYLYPLCGIFVMTLVMACAGVREWLREHAPSSYRSLMLTAGRCCMLAVCCVLLLIGLRNYKLYRFTVQTEKSETSETLAIIGDPDESVSMAVMGVRHLSWTVLQHYYPGHEIINGSCETVEADAFWYFSERYLSEEQVTQMCEKGYQIAGYGEHSISQYPFVLYYFEK